MIATRLTSRSRRVGSVAFERFFRSLALVALCLFALPAYADDDEIAKLSEEKQALEQILGGLRGKPEQLASEREQIAEAYRDLVTLEMRMRGFQVWNAFIGSVSVAHDMITKLNPSKDVAEAIVIFIYDRKFDAYKKKDAGYLPAKLKTMSDAVVKIAPALRQLDQAMRMTPEQVADQLVARGMVENTWLQRWQNTPDKVAKSDSAVTGKITFIQERIGPAKSALIEARKQIDQVVPPLRAEIDSLQRRIAELDRRIESTRQNREFLESLEKARDVAGPPPTQEVRTYPGEAKPYGSAANDYRKAWSDLKSGSINGQTYRLLGTKSSYDAYAYYGQVIKPFWETYHAASDYFWNELWIRLRQIEDSKTRQSVYQAALNRLHVTYESYSKISDREFQAMADQYYKPVRELREEEKAEGAKREAFFARLKSFKEERVELVRADPWSLKIETSQVALGDLGTSGYYLAASAWGPTYALSYLHPAGAPVGPLAGSAERYRQWREQAGKNYDFAQQVYTAAKAQAGRLSGYASQADGFASEVKPNIALWDAFYWYGGGEGALETYVTLNESSKLFNQYSAIREREAKALLETHRDSWQRAQQGEPVMQRAEAVLPQAKALLAQKKALYEIYEQGGISSFASSGRYFLEWHAITKDEIDKVKRITESLKSDDIAEQHVFKQLSNQYYWSGNDDYPHYTLESLAVIRKKYAERNGVAGQAFNDYQSAWTRFSGVEQQFNAQLAKLIGQLGDIAPGQSSYLQDDQLLYQISDFDNRWRIRTYWDWFPPNPQDLSAGWPNANSIFEQMETALKAYEARLAGVRREIADGFPKRATKIDALAQRAGAYRTAQQVGSGPSELGRILHDANEIYAPLSNAGMVKPGMPIHLAMQHFRTAYSEAWWRLSYLTNRDSTVQQYLEWLNTIDALLKQAPSPAGRDQARQWQRDLQDSLLPNSFINYYVNLNESSAQSAVARGRETLARLAGYLESFSISNQQVQQLYQTFVSAYGRGDIRGVLALLADDWHGGDGADLRDVEDTLINSFKVFDRIQYRISGFSVRPSGENSVQVSYSVKIVGDNSRQRLHHEESSQVVEEVGLVDGKPRILRTLSGSQWLR